ncbi:RNA-binding transcriptional accessory protein [Salicibibacter cibarius]|uniref:RNA-binding transcriptional accessory protein n=1 Tax=Salicibibacter cibarius TaxID=2743000 RepID=A0A7T6Z1G0_9BACI|nr:RNA-binding transcriptional accessory protein [Salicibibacter cibarius]
METVTIDTEKTIGRIARGISTEQRYVKAIIDLHEDGNTIPFIARYRKEQTGNADELNIREVLDQWQYANQLHDRQQEVLRLIDEQGKLTDELAEAVQSATKLQDVEDIYRPYKQKRRTKATIAKEKGLEPFAERLFQLPREIDVEREADAYINPEEDLNDRAAVLEGANNIIAEWTADDPTVRQTIRELTFQNGQLQTARKKDAADEAGTYEMYYEYAERINRMPEHRILAVNRGEKDNVLKVNVDADDSFLINKIENLVIKRFGSPAVPVVQEAIKDGYKRLIAPAVEREIRNELTEKAETRAIHVFSDNLKQLLLQPPFLGKMVLGIDPAYRTGCKWAVIDETGKMLETGVFYPTPPKNEKEKSAKELEALLNKYDCKVIAIGNGTASQETELFVSEFLSETDSDAAYVIINEAGASVYSASEIAREEFPDLEVEERSAISIARRLQDPLSELVKIDPQSIGVGQYQHDVSAKSLGSSLDFVVETAVNQVGVDVNTASQSLLQHVSGLNKTVANQIVKYREDNGKYNTRKQLNDVPRLGAKTFEQAAGFLRISDGNEPLDRTPIHPESYAVTEQLLQEMDVLENALGSNTIQEKVEQLDISEASRQLDIGEMTLQDIAKALARPNRDPREDLPQPLLKTGVMAMEDLEKGMELQGTVRNVVDFGAFIDVGVKEDGLVHISKLANRFIKHPQEVVAVGDIVTVWVDDVDLKKGRIALTMKKPA